MPDEHDRSIAAVPAAPQPRWKRASLWVPVVLVLTIGTLYPFEREIARAKEVLVVDEEKRAVAGASVEQAWEHYTIERADHTDIQVTDTFGHVHFPRRAIRASLFSLCLGAVRNFMRLYVHASYGPYESIIVWFNGYGRDRSGFPLTQSEVLPPVLEDGIAKQKVIIRPRR
jgi:hypothetical protein